LTNISISVSIMGSDIREEQLSARCKVDVGYEQNGAG
jgi:hypothetical protein